MTDAEFEQRYAAMRKFFDAVDTGDPCQIESIDMSITPAVMRVRCGDSPILTVSIEVSDEHFE